MSTSETAATVSATAEESKAPRVLHSHIAGIAKDQAGKGQISDILLDLNQIWCSVSDNVRKQESYQPAALQDLADNIEAMGGLLQNIGVIEIAPSPERLDRHYAVAYGFRRYFALSILAEKDASWGTNISCKLIECDNELDFFLAQASENWIKKDLDPIEKAVSLQRAMAAGGENYTQAELADTLGVSGALVSQYMALLDLPKEVQAMLHNGELKFSHARLLSLVPGNDQKVSAAQLGSKTPYEKFKKMIEQRYCSAPTSDAEDVKVNTVKADGTEGVEAAGQGAATDATETETDTTQKRPMVLRAADLDKVYLPFLKKQVEAADRSEVKFTARDLELARLDAVRTVLRQPDTYLQQAIAPFIAAQEAEEEAEKAKKNAEGAKKKFFADQVKEVNALFNMEPDENGKRPYPEISTALAPIVAKITALQQKPEEVAKLGFELNFQTFAADLHAAWKADIEAKKAARAKRKQESEDAEKKKAEEAAKAAPAAAQSTVATDTNGEEDAGANDID
jgi:ParB/RepB/Spo0J family partition protein